MLAGRHLEPRKRESPPAGSAGPQSPQHRQRSRAGHARSGPGVRGGRVSPGLGGTLRGWQSSGGGGGAPWVGQTGNARGDLQAFSSTPAPGDPGDGVRGRGTWSLDLENETEKTSPCPKPRGCRARVHPARRASWVARRSWTFDQAQHGAGHVEGDGSPAAHGRGSVRWREQGGGHGPGGGLREEGSPAGWWSVTQGHAHLPLGSQARRVEGCGLRLLIYTRWLNPDNPQQTLRTPPGCSRAQTRSGGKAGASLGSPPCSPGSAPARWRGPSLALPSPMLRGLGALPRPRPPSALSSGSAGPLALRGRLT